MSAKPKKPDGAEASALGIEAKLTEGGPPASTSVPSLPQRSEWKDLNVEHPSKPCVPLPELVVVWCPAHALNGCPDCGGIGSVLIDKALLKEWKPCGS